MPDNIKKSFKNYVEKVYAEDILNKIQYMEIKRAYFAGLAWFKEEMVSKVGSEEKALQFFSDIDREFNDFVSRMQTNMEDI